ncbi:DUF6503 family protein [Bacteroidota bacterium]
MKYIYVPLVFILILISCKSEQDTQMIIDRCIEVHGGNRYQNAKIEFDFRDRHYIATRTNGVYKYERIFNDSLNRIHDFLTNDGFKREIDGKYANVSEEWTRRYSNSINSVIYFALLPYGLNDPAVIKEYINMSKINGQEYHKIRITFRQEGGGEDYEDKFIYWINADTYTMDYFAYLYYSDEGGIRFRSVSDVQVVNGIRFQDYMNYKLPDDNINFESIDSLFELGDLELLSEIKNENRIVNLTGNQN